MQLAHERVKVKERRLKVAKMAGALESRRALEREFFELIRAERERLMNWPADVAPRLAAALGVDSVQVEIALEAEVRKLLEGLTAESLRAPGGEHAA